MTIYDDLMLRFNARMRELDAASKADVRDIRASVDRHIAQVEGSLRAAALVCPSGDFDDSRMADALNLRRADNILALFEQHRTAFAEALRRATPQRRRA